MPAEGVDRALGASYQLVELIGRGAAGDVWRGLDRRTDEPIAAKLLRSEYVEDHELVGRFLRERSILVGLRHPSIVAVRDLVAEGDRLAIVMEYVDGGSLRTALGGGPRETFERVQSKGSPLPGYKGGSTFANDGRNGGEILPNGDGVTYREWDINPYAKGVDRGPERIVSGSDGGAYYTNNHYETFIQFWGSGR